MIECRIVNRGRFLSSTYILPFPEGGGGVRRGRDLSIICKTIRRVLTLYSH